MNDDAGCPNGTTIVIRDLFFNTPARMKFLKKDVTEANAISAVIDRMALSHPEISFRFIRDGKETLLTHGDSKLISSIHSVFSKDFADSLIEIDYTLDGIKVRGYISKPLNSRPNRSMQYFFINNRFVKSKTAFIALEEAYKNQIMVGKFPACVLNIQIPFNLVDVNVHPAKLEVRFSNEKAVFNAVYYACLNAISQKDTRPVIDLSKISSKPTYTSTVIDQGVQTRFSNQSFNSNSSTGVYPYKKVQNDDFWQSKKTFDFSKETVNKTNSVMSTPIEKNPVDIYFDNTKVVEKIEKDDIDIQCDDNVQADKPQIRLIGEAFKTYIFAEVDSKLLIIDKHAAHERILFEKIKNEADLSKRQILMIPVTVTLSKDEYNAVIENLDVLEKSGYLVEDFGIGSVIVRECPLSITKDDIESIISEIAGYLVNNKNIVLPEKMDWIFHSSACRGAIKAGDHTSSYEMEKFVQMLLQNDDIRYCPHGRPVLIEMTKRELEKFFGRIV